MLGTQVNALIAFLRQEALALTKDSSYELIYLSNHVCQMPGGRPGVPSPRAAIKFANAPPLDWRLKQMPVVAPGGGVHGHHWN